MKKSNRTEKLSRTEVDALIRLLDDTDAEIYKQIQDRLVHLGKDVIPILENAWGTSMDTIMQERIESIIHKIQFDELRHELHVWSHSDSHDLIKGALLVA